MKQKSIRLPVCKRSSGFIPVEANQAKHDNPGNRLLNGTYYTIGLRYQDMIPEPYCIVSAVD